MLNTPLLRGTLYTLAFACPLWAFVAVWWSLPAFAALMIAGMTAWIAGGFIEREDEM